ncbi:CHAT domain-containing protein [Salsipaludibacter albus]|uniref:CHAT domain-containing protein n=1 Tax=Salsipaludibacter albus TaxID=2849650 RepID=UPI001EE4066B|nr:CHAT domain-containing protein [Salsipaludibacter albus]MBY5162462.1 CHAT domain-containing protein [Salsipaludibacter albus]
MQPPTYRNFDLAVVREGDRLVARVLESPVGQAEHRFDWPFDARDLELLVLTAGRTRIGVRRVGSPQMARARSFGQQLHDTVLGGAVGTCLLRSLDAVEREDARLRIRLRLTDVPELHDVPWEFLWSDELGRFLVVSLDTPLVRYLDLARTPRPLQVATPLRVVALVALPQGAAALDVDREAANLRDALAPVVATGRVVLEQLPDGTADGLQDRLRRGDAHVLHVVGHGGFDPGTGEGVVVLEDAEGRPRLVTADELGTILHDHRPLRLVVLNSCEGARTGAEDPYGGVAQALVRQGIPAVVAMQFEITDRAAIIFSRALHRSIADGFPIDAAVSEGRKALFAAGNDVEWATPVLFMRTPDGRIFDLAPGHPVSTSDEPVSEVTPFAIPPRPRDPPGERGPERGATRDPDGSAPHGRAVTRTGRGRGVAIAVVTVLVVVIAGFGWWATRDDEVGTDDGSSVPAGAVRVASACETGELSGHLGPAERSGRLVRLPVHVVNVDPRAEYVINGVTEVRDQDGNLLTTNEGVLAEAQTLDPDEVLDAVLTVTPGETALEAVTVTFNLACENLTTEAVPVP